MVVSHKKYPTPWQRQTMWAALSAFFVVVLVGIIASVIWLGVKLIAFLQPILIPIAIAAILAYLLDPLVTHLSARRFTRTKAIALLFAVAFLAVAALFTWLVPVISLQSATFARELPGYTSRARDQVVELIYRYNRDLGAPAAGKGKSPSAARSLVNWLLPSPAATPAKTVASKSPAPGNERPLPIEEISAAPAKLSSAERQRIQEWVEKLLPNLQSQLPNFADKSWNLLKTSIGGFLGITGFLLSLVMVPIYLFFFLKERPAIERRWKEYLPLRNSPLKDEVATVLTQINSYVIAYFRGQLLVCLINGALIGIALSLLGLNFAPLIGLLVVVLTMIPYLGIVLCWVPAVLIAAAQWGDWTHPLIVTLIFFGIQNLEAIFLAPRIVGNSVGLHPMTVIVSIFVWGLLIGGLLGPILAVPLTATLKVLLARYVWGRRLRERVKEQIEEVPVVQAANEQAIA
jgi:predicted PurR-regulated permease PerM